MSKPILMTTINVKGYTTPRPFSGFQIPIPLQSLSIRRYCEDRGLVFNHHVVENISPKTYFVLERVVKEAHLYQAIAMCSIGLLPNDETYRSTMLNQCVTAGVSVHFIFEQLVVSSEADIASLNDLLSLSSLSPQWPEEIRHLTSLIGDL